MADLMELKNQGVLDIKQKDAINMEEILKNKKDVMAEITKRI